MNFKMKKRILGLVLLLTLIAEIVVAQISRDPRAIAVEQNVRRWAMLVGVNDYVKFGDLKYCVSDVTGLRDELLKHGYEEKRIFCLTTRSNDGVNFQPTLANIDRTIKQLLQQLQKGDQLLIVLSGHGLMIGGKSYFCPEDADDVHPETTLLDIEQLYQIVEQSKATNKMIVVDACRNRPSDSTVEIPENVVQQTSQDPLKGRKAASGAKGIEKLPPPPAGIVLLTSCNEGEYSFEDSNLGHGVFTHFLINAVQGKADMNNDGLISLLELSNYVCEETPLYTMKKFSAAQTPYLAGKTTAYYIAATQVKPKVENQINSETTMIVSPEKPEQEKQNTKPRGIAKEYTLNLSNISLGSLPQGWEGPDNAVVNNLGGGKCVTNNTDRNPAELTVNNLFNQPGDFSVHFTCILLSGVRSTSGKIIDENGNTIPFQIAGYGSGYTLGDSPSKRTPLKFTKGIASGGYTITRRGNIVSMTCDGFEDEVITIRTSTFKTLTGFSITIPSTYFGISQFSVRQINESDDKK
jgi:uncharacterized caspase-like protein